MNIFDIKLETSRLILRNLKKTDDQDMYEYTSCQETTKYLEWDAHKDVKQTSQFIEKTITDNKNYTRSYAWGIELKQNSKLIGVIKIYDYSIKDKRAEISYILNQHYSGKGYMTEAILTLIKFLFMSLALNRIQAKCSIQNKGSEEVMKRTRMLFEGLMSQYSYIKGEFHDVLLYAITLSKYNESLLST